MNEPRDSPARRQQFKVICTIMAGMFIHSVITAGAFMTIHIKEGVFPGGEFIYRYNERDYAATYGLFEEISRDLNITQAQNADFLYAVYLDDPMVVAAQRQRFGTGVLVDGSRKSIKTKALKLNEAIAKIPPAERSEEVSTHHKWEFSNLPSVDAAIVQFPSTYGFVSALITSYKIIPTLRKYAQENGEKGSVPVVVSTCSETQRMCTHYAPLVRGKKFLLGQVDSETFFAGSAPESWVDWAGLTEDLRRIFPPLRLVLN